jgi:hypothetical protein
MHYGRVARRQTTFLSALAPGRCAMGLCPLQFIGMSDGLYVYGGINCAHGGSGSGSDTRQHRLGINCSNILDPIGACGDVDHVCGCHHTGIKNHVTLQEEFMPQKPAKLLGQCTAEYTDGRQKRKARLFLVQWRPRGKRPTVLRVGLELEPKTALPDEGCFQATLSHKTGCYHCIRLDGMDGHQFHVVVKGPAKPVGKRGGPGKRSGASH